MTLTSEKGLVLLVVSSHEQWLILIPWVNGAVPGQITALGWQPHLDLLQPPVVGPNYRERSPKDDSQVRDWGRVRGRDGGHCPGKE